MTVGGRSVRVAFHGAHDIGHERVRAEDALNRSGATSARPPRGSDASRLRQPAPADRRDESPGRADRATRAPDARDERVPPRRAVGPGPGAARPRRRRADGRQLRVPADDDPAHDAHRDHDDEHESACGACDEEDRFEVDRHSDRPQTAVDACCGRKAGVGCPAREALEACDDRRAMEAWRFARSGRGDDIRFSMIRYAEDCTPIGDGGCVRCESARRYLVRAHAPWTSMNSTHAPPAVLPGRRTELSSRLARTSAVCTSRRPAHRRSASGSVPHSRSSSSTAAMSAAE